MIFPVSLLSSTTSTTSSGNPVALDNCFLQNFSKYSHYWICSNIGLDPIVLSLIEDWITSSLSTSSYLAVSSRILLFSASLFFFNSSLSFLSYSLFYLSKRSFVILSFRSWYSLFLLSFSSSLYLILFYIEDIQSISWTRYCCFWH